MAIAGVLATHAGLRGILGIGGHGVTLFFVLSGFLITALLLREHADTGRVRLRHFYIRRGLRLLPVILVAAALGAASRLVFPHNPQSPTWAGIAAMVFYVSNWMHLRVPGALGFLTPTWSLAIEEQFYLVWPPVVLALLAWGKGRRHIAAVAGYGAVAAAVYRLSTTAGQSGSDAAHAWYYDSLKRADALLIGCLLAAVLSPAVVAYLRRRPRWATGMAWAGLAGTAWIGAHWLRDANQAFDSFWGLVVLELCFALVLCSLVTVPTSGLASLLSLRWLVWLGRRSYGLYVLHAPVFDLVQGFHRLHGNALAATEMLLSVVAAALSYRFVETPALRLKRRFGGKAI